MTQLFGCICNQPQRIVEALEPVREGLVAKGPIARWGLGYVQAGEVLINLHPRPSETDIDFFEEVGSIHTDYLICAANQADGLEGNAHTQPFRFRRWMFAQEGSIDHFEQLQPTLLEHIPDFLRRNMRGKMPSEHIFHLFLSMLHDAGRIDDPNIPPGQSRLAMRDTLAFVYALLTKLPPPEGANGEAGERATAHLGNLIVTNGRSMIAVRLGRPMYVRRFKELTDARRPESQFKSVIVVSADEMPGEGFEEIPQRSVVAISRDVLTEVVDLDG